jgi:hypothetical protein
MVADDEQPVVIGNDNEDDDDDGEGAELGGHVRIRAKLSEPPPQQHSERAPSTPQTDAAA